MPTAFGLIGTLFTIMGLFLMITAETEAGRMRALATGLNVQGLFIEAILFLMLAVLCLATAAISYYLRRILQSLQSSFADARDIRQ